MSSVMWVTVCSVLIAFFCLLGAFALFMYGKPRKWVWLLGGLAFVCVTVIPVGIAVFYASVNN
ncbi:MULTISPECIES: hypothetical protein [Corynebacterium]|uniref:hypothetical protein n=1 Tax=Corynebacterium TaxID=1716 RepID=UPI0025515274|nr:MULTISPECIES: hypothetical protein [Corynebacterium]MDK6260918.1 hypothetical protein [Corynebacterium frankenforstense]MDK8895379.1 hypothetical protein [Corynebacterium sp. MSK006]